MSIPQSTRGGRSGQPQSRPSLLIRSTYGGRWSPVCAHHIHLSFTPFLLGLSHFSTALQGKQTISYMMQCGCQKEGSKPGRERVYTGRERQERPLRREDTLLNQSWLRKVIYTLQPAFNSKSGLIITSSGTNNNLSKDHFEFFRRPFILKI